MQEGMQQTGIPGFIDLQVNGNRGVSFTSGELCTEDFVRACRNLIDAGTALLLPTVVTASDETYEHCLPLIADALERDELAGHAPGIHIEGPFLSPEPGAVGAHPPEHIRAPSIAFFDQIMTWARGKVTLLTIAADQPGAADLTRHAVARGVTVSLGHHLADEDDLADLTAAGATALTHIGNGVPNTIQRHNNPIWAALGADALTGMLITDGHHLPDALLRTILRAKGPEHCCVVSDASPVAGLPPGRYEFLGNDAILEASGLFHNPEKECLVGSSATMLQCMNYLASLDFLTLEELIAVGYSTPLRMIDVDPASVPTDTALLYDGAARHFTIA